MRIDYIKKQRDANRYILATLPIAYPKEILTAMNILAVEVWGPPGSPQSAESGRIQTYVCPIVRNAMAFLAADGINYVDGVLFPHTCDSIQGLATALPDLVGLGKSAFHFIHPKGNPRPSLRKYLKKEFESFANDLTKLTGEPIRHDKLKDAIRLHREIDKLRARFLDKRACVDMSDMELFTLLRSGEYLWPEDYLEALQQAESKIKDETVQKGVPLMIMGILPEPMSIYDVLNDADAYIVADDYAAIGRRIVRAEPGNIDDPFETLVDLYFALPPCSTRASTIDPRRNYLDKLFKESKAKGLIMHNVKFCEPELFDVPHIRKHFSKMKTPILYLESELENELSGQVVTRIEAFVEMASNQ